MLRLLLVENEFLLMMQLKLYVERSGHVVAGIATSSTEAIELAVDIVADIALIDIHLGDGPTGMEIARFITEKTNMLAVFVTATPKRVSMNFSEAVGVISKPYTQHGIGRALDYLVEAVNSPPPTMTLPRSLSLTARYENSWLHSEA